MSPPKEADLDSRPNARLPCGTACTSGASIRSTKLLGDERSVTSIGVHVIGRTLYEIIAAAEFEGMR